MNYRKFHAILCVVILITLFISGTLTMVYLNTSYGETEDDYLNNLFSELLYHLKTEEGPVNVLLLGGDLVAGNTDTIMLVNYNPSNSRLNLLSIPRDTYAEVRGSSVNKINSAYPVGGGQLAVESVSNLLNVKINYYVFISTKVFRQIIDLLGGVDYYVPVDMHYEDPYQDLYIDLKKGQQHLNGEEAEGFMRFRQPSQYTKEMWEFYDGSDEKRIEAQQNFIKELIRQKANLYSIAKIDDILMTVFKNLDTNMDMNDALKFVPSASRINVNKVKMFTLPGMSYESNLWYYQMDKEETSKLINGECNKFCV